MNINKKMMILEEATGYPVKQDIYRGKEDKFIVFTYEDERPALAADNEELAETVHLQVTFFTPESFNYFADKKIIRKALKEQGFNIESVQSWLEGKNSEIRHTVFAVNITETE